MQDIFVQSQWDALWAFLQHGRPPLWVLLAIVDQQYGRVGLHDAVHAHGHPGVGAGGLGDANVVDGFPVTVVQLECLPIDRQARREMQPVRRQSQPQ